MSWTICFDFPEEDDPVFCGLNGTAMGFVPYLSEAVRFTRESDARRTLEDRYAPKVRQYGTVVEVGAS